MASDDEGDRAGQLLRAMHRAFSHDLPNQVVALQGLLQMLELEEGGRLGPEGRDYLRRLRRVAGKTAALVHFLRDVGRLHTYQGRTDAVDLRGLLQGVAAALRQQGAGAGLQCVLDGPVRSVVADGRLLIVAVADLVRLLMGDDPDGPWRLRLSGRPVTGAVALEAELARPGAPPPAAAPLGGEPPLEMLRAQQCLAAWGARLGSVHAAAAGAGGASAAGGRFLIDVPTPAAHG